MLGCGIYIRLRFPAGSSIATILSYMLLATLRALYKFNSRDFHMKKREISSTFTFALDFLPSTPRPSKLPKKTSLTANQIARRVQVATITAG